MHPEVITSEARKIFDELRNFPQFYLAGGTGLALQLGHRISIDFDLFWEKEIPKDLLPKIRKVFKDSKIEVVVNHSE
ncbi:MAG: nucleotidyl transferase AbiEii/AbiGii toxin family protein [Minisyncoccia bacterium]